MPHLTNGSVSYERRVKTGDYEHKHSSVTIHYALDEGDDADELLSRVGALAAAHVFKMLRVRTPNGLVPGPTRTVDPVPPVAAGAVSGDLVSGSDPVVCDPVADPIPDPASGPIIPPVVNLKAAKRAVKAVVTTPEQVVPDDFTAAAPAATDAELGQALSRINAKLKDRPRIQTLIGEFVEAGQSYTMIPAVRRGEFISKLEALAELKAY